MLFLNEKASGRNAYLPGIAVLVHRHDLCRDVEIGIIKDDDRRVTAKFHGGAFHMQTSERGQALTDGG